MDFTNAKQCALVISRYLRGESVDAEELRGAVELLDDHLTGSGKPLLYEVLMSTLQEEGEICEDYADLLLEYVSCTDEQQRREFPQLTKHLQQCEGCRDFVEQHTRESAGLWQLVSNALAPDSLGLQQPLEAEFSLEAGLFTPRTTLQDYQLTAKNVLAGEGENWVPVRRWKLPDHDCKLNICVEVTTITERKLFLVSVALEFHEENHPLADAKMQIRLIETATGSEYLRAPAKAQKGFEFTTKSGCWDIEIIVYHDKPTSPVRCWIPQLKLNHNPSIDL